MRDDADYLESTDAEALALGYPHMEGPRWVRAADILGAFCTGIPSFLENVHGFFAFVVNDRTADRQLVLTDRFGGIAIYYLATRGLIALSDSVEALAKLAGALHLDRQGISEFLETGFMVGDKTHFQEIRKLRPGTINEIVSGEITTTRYWDYAALDCRTAHPGERIASEFNRYVEQGIGYSGRAALPLSGGMDSRAILAACLEHRKRLNCYTFGNFPNDDVRIVKNIRLDTSLPHRFNAINREMTETGIRDIDQLNSECSASVNAVMFSPMVLSNRMAAESEPLLLCGIGGEMLRGCLIHNRHRGPADVGSAARLLLKRFHVGRRTPGMVKHPEASPGWDFVLESYRQEMRASDACDPIRALENFYLQNRVANFGARAVYLCSKDIILWDPWLYTPILEANVSVTDRDKLHYAVHRRIIELNSPVLAGVLNAEGNWVPIAGPGPRLRLKSYSWHALRFQSKALNKVSRRLVGIQAIKAAYSDELTARFARYHREFLHENLRHDELILSDMIEEFRLRDAVDLASRGDAVAFYAITNIICAERWLRRIAEITSVRL